MDQMLCHVTTDTASAADCRVTSAAHIDVDDDTASDEVSLLYRVVINIHYRCNKR